mgnify:CR=1 FL=1
MSADPARIAEVRAWMSKAATDLRAGAHDLSAVPPILEDVVFHGQQAVEKALKALLTWNDCDFRKTHSIEELGEQCLRLDATLRPLIDRAAPLTEYAWKYRYPGEPDEPTPDEAKDALAVARNVYDAIRSRLPEEARPA